MQMEFKAYTSFPSSGKFLDTTGFTYETPGV